MLGVLILQFVMRAPDRMAAESVQYDLRWRLALHLTEDDTAFDPSLLVIFRNRLLDSGQEALAFEAILDDLVEHGWVPKRSRQRLDSTHVWGVLHEMSRLECARETIRLLLKDVEAAGAFPESWAVYWDRYVESKLDPRAGMKVFQAKSTEAGGDMLAMWREAAGCWPIATRDSFLLLQRVFLENYEVALDGRAQQTRAQPTGSIHNRSPRTRGAMEFEEHHEGQDLGRLQSASRRNHAGATSGGGRTDRQLPDCDGHAERSRQR